MKIMSSKQKPVSSPICPCGQENQATETGSSGASCVAETPLWAQLTQPPPVLKIEAGPSLFFVPVAKRTRHHNTFCGRSPNHDSLRRTVWPTEASLQTKLTVLKTEAGPFFSLYLWPREPDNRTRSAVGVQTTTA